MVLHLDNAVAVGFSELPGRTNSEDSDIGKHSYTFWPTESLSKPDHLRLELTDWDLMLFLKLQEKMHVHLQAEISISVPLASFHK